MAKKLRRYKLQGLPKLQRAQVHAINTLLCHLPQTPFEKGFKDKLRNTLEPLVHADIDIWFDGVRALAPGELKQVVAEPTCAAIIGLPPRTEKALLEVDLAIAQMSIDKILGGSAEDADVQRPLSEIEDGVFSFVLLKVLQLVAPEVEEKQLALKLEGIHGTVASLAERFPLDEHYLCLSFKLFFDLKVGYFRIYLPQEVTREAFPASLPADGPALARYLRRLQERIDVVRLVQAPLVVEVGRIGLNVADVEQLEADDIILVEQTDVRLQPADGDAPQALTGRVQCRIGDGSRGTLSGTVVVGESGRYEVQIEAISPAGEPRARTHLFRGEVEEAAMAEENARRLSRPGVADARALAAQMRRDAAARALAGAAAPLPHGDEDGAEGEHSEYDEEGGEEDAPNADAAGLLDDISVALVVELGRVQVSAADVVQLRAGQVIELSRAPGEPVDLVVDGKRIGKGELVEIDGELGVRILSLSK
jgi:type III secretion system YscQ/HrcQ family protein